MKPFKSSPITKCLPIAGGSLLMTATSSFAAIVFSSSVGTQPNNVGIITLTQVNATSVKVLVDLQPSYGFINTGGPHTPFAFSVSGVETGVTASFQQPSGGIFGFNFLSLNLGGGDATPYGTYGIAIDSSGGNGSSASNAYYGDLEFTLSRPIGLLTTDFVANSDGYFFAADLTDGRNTGSQAWKASVTTQDGGTVPDGGTTLVLLGGSLLGLGSVRRLMLKKS